METALLSFFAIVMYLWAAAQACHWTIFPKTKKLFIEPFLAFITHTYLLYRWIDVGAGQNLSLMNLISQVIWGMVLFVLILNFRLNLKILLTFSYSLAALSIVNVLLFPSYHLVNAKVDFVTFGHIMLALLAFSVLLLASLASLLVFFQNLFLRKKYALYIHRYFPPLESSESLFFYALGVGFLLLTLVLIMGFYSINNEVIQSEFLIKIILSLISWGVFLVLLIGKFVFSWKRKREMNFTIFGLTLLWISLILTWI